VVKEELRPERDYTHIYVPPNIGRVGKPKRIAGSVI